MYHQYLDLAPEVSDALNQGDPVVALESTIIAHGMPFPQNVNLCLQAGAAIWEAGAVPATIAILDGRLKVGLSEEELQMIGSGEEEVLKASRRDLPILLARRQHGATTVAATMIVARLAGIAAFATGGIGGVHRGAAQTMDISADLQELARTNVAVVCAGAKSILDLELTLEYLETYGVPVLGYQTEEFPAFYTPHSGLKVDARVENTEEAARIMKAKWELGLNGGLVVANPIPENFALPAHKAEAAVRRAIGEAEARGIKGKSLTPFLLAKVEELTAGRSLDANMELVLNNARLAARLASDYARLSRIRS